MKITKDVVALKIGAYLKHEISLADLVEWAESAMMEDEFDEHGFETIRDIIAHLGLADVRSFGLTWEDCEDMLRRLGYSARIELIAA